MHHDVPNIRRLFREEIDRNDAKTVDANAVIHVILRHFPKTSADQARRIVLELADRLGYIPVWL